MKLRGLTLSLNGDCNYRCAYCYQRPRSPSTLGFRRARRALAFFLPYLTRTFQVSFYGGEPLLEFGTIRRLVTFLREQEIVLGRKARLAITTNGSLLSEEVIAFLNRERFALTLSFDGLAQDKLRPKGSYEQILGRLPVLLRQSRLSLSINSVFTPETIGDLSGSMELLLGLGARRISFALSVLRPWGASSLSRYQDELDKVRGLALARFRRSGDFPIDGFEPGLSKGIFSCAGGSRWLAIDADGGLWGCPLLGDCFRQKPRAEERRLYSFGPLARFVRDPGGKYAAHAPYYARLSQDNFHSVDGPCFLCSDLERCAVCPAAAAMSGSPLGVIPGFICRIQKIRSRQIRKFQDELA